MGVTFSGRRELFKFDISIIFGVYYFGIMVKYGILYTVFGRVFRTRFCTTKRKKNAFLRLKIEDWRLKTTHNNEQSVFARRSNSNLRIQKKKKFNLEKRKKILPLERHITLYCIIIYSWCQILYFSKSVDWNNIVLLYVYMDINI